jgi:photosystem II stability/assembly factor-like uncharacterized protein
LADRSTTGGVLRSALAAAGLWYALTCPPSFAQQLEFSVLAPLAARALLLDANPAGDAIIAVGERGHVLRSEDQGVTWRQIQVPTRAMLTAVAFHAGGLGVAVGHDATILRTRDGGRTWERAHFEPEEQRPLLDVRFLDAENVVAVGAYGYFLQSGDGGGTWTPRDLIAMPFGADDDPADEAENYPEDFHFNHFSVSDGGKWYLAAEAGNIYRSDDRGETWLRLPSPYEGSFMGLLPLNRERLLVFGLQGKLFLSEDAGLNWREIETGTRATLSSARVLRDGRILVVGYSGSVLTADAKMSAIRLTQLEERMGISSALQLERGDLVLFGTGGMLRVPLTKLAH